MNNFLYPNIVNFHSEPDDDDDFDWSDIVPSGDDASGDSDLYDIFGPK